MGGQYSLLDLPGGAASDTARRFFAIDLPMLSGQFKLMFILAIVQLLQFAVPVALLTNGGPAYATMMPVVYLLKTAFVDSNWGYAAALSSVLFVIMVTLSAVSLRLSQPRRSAQADG
jgi:raffinose/stachyose/melibiose transport system permease protein